MERRHTFVSMLSRVAGVCLLFFSFSSSSVASCLLKNYYSSDADAQSACTSAIAGLTGWWCEFQAASGADSSPKHCNVGVIDVFLPRDTLGNCQIEQFLGCTGGFSSTYCPSGQTWNATTQSCYTPPPTCSLASGTVHNFSGTGSLPSGSVCDTNCNFNYTGVGVRLVNANTWNMSGTSDGTYCSVSSGITSSPSLPTGGTGCSQQTLVNGQIQYNCGDLSGQIKCSFVNGSFQCSGGSAAAGAKCWTGTNGVINCIGAGSVPSTTPIATQTQKTTNPDGTSSSTVTQMLPGGGTVTITTTYDSFGTPTGTTTTSDSPVDSGTGTGGDGAGGGPGDGTSLPAPGVPSDTIVPTDTAVPGLTATSYLSGSAGCPTATSVTYFGHTFSLSWTPVCNVLGIVYYAMLAGAAFYAATIFYGYVQRGTS
jgi:hypothetical protein